MSDNVEKRFETDILLVKKPTVTETIRLNRLHRFGHAQRMEENRISKRVLYMNLGTTRLRGRPRKKMAS